MEFDALIENVDNLPLENQAIFIDIINKRFAEKNRDNFIEESLESMKEYNSGNFETGNSEDIFKLLKI